MRSRQIVGGEEEHRGKNNINSYFCVPCVLFFQRIAGTRQTVDAAFFRWQKEPEQANSPV
jgi:hypothetical protein